MSDACASQAGARPEESRACSSANLSSLTTPIAVNDTDTATGNVIGGSDVILAKFQFFSGSEPLRLTKASFSVATAGTVNSLTLFDGPTLLAGPIGADGSGNYVFTGLVVDLPVGGTKILTVQGRINAVGSGGTQTGGNAKVTLNTSAGALELIGTTPGSSTVVTSIPGGDVSGRSKIVRKSVPTVSVVAPPSSSLTTSDTVVMRVNIGADAAGPVSLKALTVTIDKDAGIELAPVTDDTHGTVSSMDSSIDIAGHSSSTESCSSASNSSCRIRNLFDTEEVIPAGSSKTYDVHVNVSGAFLVGDAISSELLGDDQLLTGALTNGSETDQVKIAATDVAFAWSDDSAAAHSAVVGTSSTDWASGVYLKTLPTSSQTLVK